MFHHSSRAPQAPQAPPVPPTWRNIPRKSQLHILSLCRLVDFMQLGSFQTLCYYQLKAFDPSLSEETLSWQTGIAQGSFTAAQFCTAMLWGWAADNGGR